MISVPGRKFNFLLGRIRAGGATPPSTHHATTAAMGWYPPRTIYGVCLRCCPHTFSAADAAADPAVTTAAAAAATVAAEVAAAAAAAARTVSLRVQWFWLSRGGDRRRRLEVVRGRLDSQQCQKNGQKTCMITRRGQLSQGLTQQSFIKLATLHPTTLQSILVRT